MDKYDVAVIGGGVAGLIAANYLVRAGKNTILLEQNHHPGGNMSGFRRKGFTFDGGDQSFESMGMVFPVLEELGLYREEDWQKARFRFVADNLDFCIDSVEIAEEALQRAFPNEPGIKPLFEGIREVSRFIDAMCSPTSFPLLHQFGLGPLLKAARWLPKVRHWMTFKDRERMCSVIQDPGLRHWFTNIGYYRMTYLFFAGFWHIWAKDYWYPAGGMQAFLDRLATRYTEQGGTVRFNTRVTGLPAVGSRVKQVELADDEPIQADTVIYCGDYRELVSHLLPPGLFPGRFQRRVRESRLTESLVNVYLGIDTPPQQTAEILQAQHVFVFPNYEVIFPEKDSPQDIHGKMWVTANFTGDRNPGLAPEGKSSVVLQTYSAYDWQNTWENGGDSLPRTRAYQELKHSVGMELVETMERVFPRLEDKIEYMDVGTPVSSKRFTMNTDGSSGGWCYDDRISPVYRTPGKNLFRTPLNNLYAAGHYALWPGGVISAVLSGRLVTNLALGRRILTAMGR